MNKFKIIVCKPHPELVGTIIELMKITGQKKKSKLDLIIEQLAVINTRLDVIEHRLDVIEDRLNRNHID
jgi:hypothetical protein